MTNHNGDDLSKLYPSPKTYEQRRQERQQRQQRQRPRYPALKISLWSTLLIVMALGAYQLTYRLMVDSLSSAGQVAFGASISILLLTFTVLVLAYLWFLIKRMIERLQSWTSPLTLVVTVVLLVSGIALTLLIQYGQLDIGLASVVLAFNVLATYLVVAVAASRNS